MNSPYAVYIKTLKGTFGSVAIYGALQRTFLVYAVVALIGSSIIDAPFGRFSLKKGNLLNIPGKWGWFIQEITSPITFLSAMAYQIDIRDETFSSLPVTHQVVTGLYLIHYFNRSILAPLWRNPSMAPSHLIVVSAAVAFNLINGYLLGTYLSTPPSSSSPSSIPLAFWIGVVLWAGGFVSNIYHDEILYSLKRNKTSESKSRYSIPQGGLYKYISYPNYFSEWVEWSGWMLALESVGGGGHFGLTEILRVPNGFEPLESWYAQPPALFVINDVAAMLPRAVRGQRWYRRTFGQDFPKDRKIVIPGIL